jgi:hypothetical protein
MSSGGQGIGGVNFVTPFVEALLETPPAALPAPESPSSTAVNQRLSGSCCASR